MVTKLHGFVPRSSILNEMIKTFLISCVANSYFSRIKKTLTNELNCNSMLNLESIFPTLQNRIKMLRNMWVLKYDIIEISCDVCRIGLLICWCLACCGKPVEKLQTERYIGTLLSRLLMDKMSLILTIFSCTAIILLLITKMQPPVLLWIHKTSRHRARQRSSSRLPRRFARCLPRQHRSRREPWRSKNQGASWWTRRAKKPDWGEKERRASEEVEGFAICFRMA